MLHCTIQLTKERPMIPAGREYHTDSSPGSTSRLRRRVPAVGQLFEALSALRKMPAAAEPVVLRPAPSKSGLDDTLLGFLIHDVSRMRRSAYDQFMKPIGITRTQWWVLAQLSQADGMMQTQLADALGVGKASLGIIIESLEVGGWVERRSDPSDRRVKRIFLTRSAQSMIERATVMEARFNERIFGELLPAEKTDLARMLLTVKRAISGLSATAENAVADV
jgi:DNA-binding MarR family transcriptional regulator